MQGEGRPGREGVPRPFPGSCPPRSLPGCPAAGHGGAEPGTRCRSAGAGSPRGSGVSGNRRPAPGRSPAWWDLHLICMLHPLAPRCRPFNPNSYLPSRRCPHPTAPRTPPIPPPTPQLAPPDSPCPCSPNSIAPCTPQPPPPPRPPLTAQRHRRTGSCRGTRSRQRPSGCKPRGRAGTGRGLRAAAGPTAAPGPPR